MDALEARNLIESLIALNILERKENPSKGSDKGSLYIELIEDLDELIDDILDEKFGYLN